jgi:hypothetical protein
MDWIWIWIGSGLNTDSMQSTVVAGKVEKKLEKNPVLRIRDILGWIRIRIRGSMTLTNGS